MNPPFIEVFVSDEGVFQYRLRPTLLDTRQYGQVLAQIALQIGAMMELEGGFNKTAVTAQIVQHFNAEIASPSAQSDIQELTLQ